MYTGNGDFIVLVVVAASIGFAWFCCIMGKQHQSDIDEVHAEYHFLKMLELSYREDAGETLTPHEARQLEAARILEAAQR